MDSLNAALEQELHALRSRDVFRRVRVQDTPPGRFTRIDGRQLRVFGSNNYLGLAAHPEIIEAARRACEEWGAGSTGSRLTTGTLALHQQLEAELAALKGTEDALLFGSGYLAAVGTIPALVGRGDLILSDELNHASLIDGCRLSRAELRIYRHGDLDHVKALLEDGSRFRRRLLVTDGVFSMDGDLAPLREISCYCETTDTWLMVDDAHGTGVLGPNGGGTAELFGVSNQVQVQMGTLSKALGSEGAFIAGSKVLIEYLRNRARSFIFSTSPSPPAVAAALAAVGLIHREPERRRFLCSASQRLREDLRSLGLSVPDGSTPIVPVILGEPSRAIQWSRDLEGLGLWVPAIRPPTVPEGTARLRLSLTAALTGEDIGFAIDAFTAIQAASIPSICPGVPDPSA